MTGESYSKVMKPLDRVGFQDWRRWATADARGRVLEIGIGTGLNSTYYSSESRIVGFDVDLEMLDEAEKETCSRPAITLVTADAGDLPFSESTFDSVVGTLVFCTISDPLRALRETRRVMKAGAPLRLVEHVRARNLVLGGIMDVATPLWSRAAGGCHLNRHTLEAVGDSGLKIEAVQYKWFGFVIGIEARK